MKLALPNGNSRSGLCQIFGVALAIVRVVTLLGIMVFSFDVTICRLRAIGFKCVFLSGTIL